MVSTNHVVKGRCAYVGDVDLNVPRDQKGTFCPERVQKGSPQLGGDEMIISLYAGGMTVRDIEHFLTSKLGAELSYEAIDMAWVLFRSVYADGVYA